MDSVATQPEALVPAGRPAVPLLVPAVQLSARAGRREQAGRDLAPVGPRPQVPRAIRAIREPALKA